MEQMNLIISTVLIILGTFDIATLASPMKHDHPEFNSERKAHKDFSRLSIKREVHVPEELVSRGEDSDVSSCVSQCKSVCTLPEDTGPGKAYIKKYYFDLATQQCKEFIYGGIEGNGNRFNTVKECQKTCACFLPKCRGPCKGYFPRFYFNYYTKTCDQFIYGGCGGNANNFKTETECLKTCPCNQFPEIPPVKICCLPKVVGPCKARIPRYFYNKRTKECELFSYGGCGGNKNNFKSLEECNSACNYSDVSSCVSQCKSVCTLPEDTGPGKACIKKYYFDLTTQQCKEFIYGGIEGNGNRFNTVKECQKTCACFLPKYRGPCKGYFPRFYFNYFTQTCDQFIYGGCQGNANNFKTEAECLKTCPHPPVEA